MKRIVGFILLTTIAFEGYAQRVLTLDSCRTLALANNKELRISKEKMDAAYYQRKAAFTNYLPKIDLAGGYIRSQKEFSLLNDNEKQSLGTAGTQLQQQLQQLASNNPAIAEVLKPLQSVMPELAAGLNGVGQSIIDRFRTDTRNMYAGAAILTQPLYMGGKIVAYNKITKYAEQLAASQHATGTQEMILNTDQAYWQVISLVNKKKLAESYLKLVQHLNDDLDKMVAQGVATKADGLSVKVKVNEAEMTLTRVDNGLSLSKMVLCQLCGIPLDSDIRLADENMQNLAVPTATTDSNVATALENREELKSLALAEQIYRQKVNVVRSDFLPSVALTATYMATNPSVFNSFENKFKGMWAAGVMVKIPVFHWGEGIYKVKAAKAEANIARFQLADVKEKVELQVTQSAYKVNEAVKKLDMAKKNMEKADENLRYANAGFKEGVIATSNVLEAQTAWLSAQSDKIDAQIDMKMSEVYLNKAMGTLK